MEAWAETEQRSGGRLVVTPEGDLATGDPRERPLPRDIDERLTLARRFVADRCLYGVDLNPMAVEIAKLSLWLTTLQKDRPFTFLDHALRVGDSLLGLTDADQLEHFHMRPVVDTQLVLHGSEMRAALKRALEARRKLESIAVVDIGDVEEKQRLLAEASDAMRELKVVADLLVGAALDQGEALHGAIALEVTATFKTAGSARLARVAALADRARQLLRTRTPFHWLLEFPEVFLSSSSSGRGFDAVIGNPPFVGGLKLETLFGADWRAFLVRYLANGVVGVRGTADLCAYFFLRAAELVCRDGGYGLLATNTIAQGDSREVGLDQLVTKLGCLIHRAVPSRPWPGEANLEIAHVWIKRGTWKGDYVLDDMQVTSITPSLTEAGRVEGKPFRLAANVGKSFQGSNLLGTGFVLTPEVASELIRKDKRHKQVVFKYLNGEDLNTQIDQAPTRWVIDFHDWPLDSENVSRRVPRSFRSGLP